MSVASPHPAQLWVGPSAVVEQQLIPYIQTYVCPQEGCGTCVRCTQVARHASHAVWWVTPEKQSYAKAEAEQIAQRCMLMLEADEHFFIVLRGAEYMTPAAAHALLKLLEEPPRGYHFVLCAERPGLLLPTIISRCVRVACDGEGAHKTPQFLKLLQELDHTQRMHFSKLYDAADMHDQMTGILLDELLVYWRRHYQAMADKERAQNIINTILAACERPPMPGSAKLFWRNLYSMLLAA